MEYNKIKQALRDLVDIAEEEWGSQTTDIMICTALESDNRLIAIRPLWKPENVLDFPFPPPKGYHN